jgi:hypothetical protein
VIHNHPFAQPEAPAAVPDLLDLAAWFMSGDNALVSLWPFAKVLVIDATDIGTANRRGLDSEQNLTVPRARHLHRSEFDRTVSRQERRLHCPIHGPNLPKPHQQPNVSSSPTSAVRPV